MEFLYKLNEYMLLYVLNIQETVHKAKKDSFILIILSKKKHNLLGGKNISINRLKSIIMKSPFINH